MLTFYNLNEVYWHDIITPEYNISDRREIIKEVKRIKPREMKEFYNKLLINDLTKQELVLLS